MHSLSSGRFFPTPQDSVRLSGTALLSGIRTVKCHPSQPCRHSKGHNHPSYQFDTKLRRDVQSTQPGPVIGGHSLSRQLYQKRLSRKIFILYLIKQHSRQRQNTGHQCRSSMVFQPECKDRRQCQESPQHQKISHRYCAEQQNCSERGRNSHLDGCDGNADSVKGQLQKQAETADHPEFGAV